SSLIGLTLSDETKCGKCPPTPKVYEELRCVGVLDNNGCCFERFDCPDWNALDSNKCHYKGRSYNVSEKVMESDSPPCSPACHCSEGYDGIRPLFRCASVDCPENFGFEEPDDCVYQYSLDKCCNVNKVCGEEKLNNLHKCELDGKTYNEGEKMYPESSTCHTCLCKKGFNNSIPIESNENCKKADCGIELRNLNRLQNGCVPIYFGSSDCCPIDFRCPSTKDEVMPIEGRSDVDDVPAEKACKYGDHILNIGQSLNSLEDKCVECTCKQPPMVECVKQSNC
ncbi:hypothetical protein Bhyg_02931, partial [Pseudolycoriella hygida]